MLESKDSNYPQKEQTLFHENVMVSSYEDINDERMRKK